MKKLRLLVYSAVALQLFGACGPTHHLPPAGSTDTHIEHKDSVTYKVDTLRIKVPVEKIKEVVPELDTLKMETSVAKAVAYLDTTTRTLKGALENKKTELKQPQVVYKEKISYRDTTIYKKEPYPVEVEKEVKVVPKFVKFFAIWGGISLLGLILYFLIKILKFGIKL